MAETALGGALPAGDANGLDALAGALITDPHHLRAVLVLVDCAKIVQKTDSGEKIAVARVRRIEVILPEDFGQAERLIRRSLEKRTGQTVLPLDLEDDIRAAFAEVDFSAEPDAAEAEAEAQAEADTPEAPEPGDTPPEPPAKPRRGRKPRQAAEPEPEPPQAAPEPAEAQAAEVDPDGPDPADLAEPWDDDPRNDPPEG